MTAGKTDEETGDGLRDGIDGLIAALSETHRMHRKVKFLLDIRGLLVINRTEGDYVEFGVFRGEMMYAAGRVLGTRIRRYIGLDTFEGLPEPDGRDAELFVYERAGAMASPEQVARALMAGFDAHLVKGDFRHPEVAARLRALAGPISVLSVDCNWPSSVEAALRASAPLLRAGTLVFLDDYFVAAREPNFHEPLLRRIEQEFALRFVEFMTYPPCARAFIVERRA